MFEDFKSRVELLLGEIAGDPEDAHALQERLRETLAEMRALGMPLPADLVALERNLDSDLAVTPLGRARPRDPA